MRWLIESKGLSELEKQGEQEASNLGETDGGGLFAETLTAEVEAVFANYTSLVGAQTTEEAEKDVRPRGLKRELTVTTPLTRPLSVFSRTREPNGVVCHGGTTDG